VIEPHATMEHSKVSRAALQAGQATVARMRGPARPSHGLGPAWADRESSESWAVPAWQPPEDVPEERTRCALLTRYAFGDYRRLPEIHRRRHSDRLATTLRGRCGPVSGLGANLCAVGLA
jgi:hypothetical protein